MSVFEHDEPATVCLTEPERSAPRRLRPVHLAIAAVSLLTAAAVTVAVLLAVGWRRLPVNEYQVRVFLKEDTTAAQTEALRASVQRLAGDDEVRVWTGAESFAEYTKVREAMGESVPPSVTADSLPGMVVITTSGRDFDCAPYAILQRDPSITSVTIVVFDDGVTPLAGTTCWSSKQ